MLSSANRARKRGSAKVRGKLRGSDSSTHGRDHGDLCGRSEGSAQQPQRQYSASLRVSELPRKVHGAFRSCAGATSQVAWTRATSSPPASVIVASTCTSIGTAGRGGSATLLSTTIVPRAFFTYSVASLVTIARVPTGSAVVIASPLASSPT